MRWILQQRLRHSDCWLEKTLLNVESSCKESWDNSHASTKYVANCSELLFRKCLKGKWASLPYHDPAEISTELRCRNIIAFNSIGPSIKRSYLNLRLCNTVKLCTVGRTVQVYLWLVHKNVRSAKLFWLSCFFGFPHGCNKENVDINWNRCVNTHESQSILA